MLKEYFAKIKELGIGKLLIILCAGIFLVLSGTGGSSKEAPGEKKVQEAEIVDYCAGEEQGSIGEILSQIQGVEQAKVLITYEDQGEEILVSGKSQEISSLSETDYQGGTRTESSQSIQEEYVFEGETPYVIKRKAPTIRGVLVVYRGNSDCVKDITEATKVLTGVDYNRIKVLTMN
ncbi:MAG: hypothetical protein ACI4AQ_03275 [Lachnospiraceae bacterium]